MTKRAKVTLRQGKVLEGIVEEIDGDKYYININGDTYKFYQGPQDIEIVEETKEDKIINFLDENNIDYGLSGDKDMLDIDITGLSYYINVAVCEDEFFAQTLHKERYDKYNGYEYQHKDAYEEAVANKKTYKTLKGIKNYILRYID